MKYIVCDIDGTCSNSTHRLHLIKNKPKDWKKFNDLVGQDGVHEDIRELVWYLMGNVHHRLVYMSGRLERTRAETMVWLSRNLFPPVNSVTSLYMRPNDDYRKDCVVKWELAQKAGLTPENTFLVLDDRDQVVQMWRERGFRCLQVANGNF